MRRSRSYCGKLSTMATYKNLPDAELLPLIKRELFSAIIGDILDKMGYLHCFLPPRIRPLREDMVVAGRAMPVLEVDLPADAAPDRKPFGMMLEALDDLRPHEVYFAAGSSPRYALWGELMSTRAMKLGAAGAVMDGWARDTSGILRLGFPTFAHGSYAQDQGPRGEVTDFRVPVQVEGVTVRPGDLIYGDRDGVLVVPREAEEEALTRAFEKLEGENLVRIAIENGMSTVEAFRTYGVM
ncbi:MAG TPA: RraA family protein [Bryobacteraceae bacterium]|nr:RraA family protein [Bryobacteraceae bacterium]